MMFGSPRNLGFTVQTAVLVIVANGCMAFGASTPQSSQEPPAEVPYSRESGLRADLTNLRKAVQTSPKSYSAHMNLGIALSDSGEWKQALAEFNAALQLQPRDPQATYDLGLTHLKMAQAMGEQHSTAYYEQLDAAQETLLRALYLSPSLPHIHEHLGWLYHQIGDQITAIQEFRTEVSLNPASGEAYNNLGTALAEAQKYDDAISVYEKALTFSPASVSAVINWESAIRRAGKKSGELTECAARVRSEPNSGVAHLMYGMLLILNDRLPEAASELHTALHIMPELTAAHFYLGEVDRLQSDNASAEREYRLAIKGAPDRVDFLGPLAVLLLSENRYKEAEGILREALNFDPQNSSLLYNLGRALHKQGETQQAMKVFSESSRLKRQAQEEGQMAMLLQEGIQDLRAGSFQQAVVALQQALVFDPNHPETNYYLGIALSQTGDMKSSTNAFERALQRRPESAEIHYNFGIALWQHGQSAEAVREFRRATGINPDDALAHCALGLALLRSGDPVEGKKEVAQAQSLGACTPHRQ